MSSNKIIFYSSLYIIGLGSYAYSLVNIDMWKVFPNIVLLIMPITVIFWPIVFLFKPSKSATSKSNKIKNTKVIKKSSKNYKDKSEELDDFNDKGLMSKVKRLKSLYKSGTLTKAEFEKAKNKLLK